ncbi:AfsR/SARP family transcriptional regulator [Streptomyces mangrovisoli]|uniref:AfsR family transcriptional regulator n=1 Tax=Streptomyces mangrovisoli TaxID=1428628 RepID=A0A1J4NXG3_9ACTN|nr:BTAD domain-containing putative transcriptional regulator [Streptomyces mangrovisoli]OIJ67175.1 AfsR family transcriptional regulator [Streptomyces mangrovisoli]
MDPVRYRILGTTQAIRPDGTTVPVGGARLRALLTVLALRPGRTVPVSVLVDEVWDGDDPPADTTAALQALVGRLRRVLGPDAVASSAGGYALAAAQDDIDLHRFDRLAGEGMRALTDGDAAKAAVVLDDALALWRGPALADLPDRGAEAARWATRHLDARRARLAAALALGAADQALPELTALCDTHPLDEPLQALRLRALRDTGRTAEALAAYDAVRRLLADRLGSDPGPELRSLHGELLQPRETVSGGTAAVAGPGPGAGEGPGGASAAAVASALADGPARSGVPGATRGPAHVGPAAPHAEGGRTGDGRTGDGRTGDGRTERASTTPAARGPRTPGPPPGNLRARLTSFVGREQDIDAIRADLASARLVTLLGPGGAGKTRLSQEAAEGVREGARDGVWLVELAPVDDPATVPEAALTALGARETVLRGAGAEEMRVAVADRHDEPVERLVEHCARRTMLIVLDNCEHVVDAAARLVEQLLERCPGLTVLATSREPLGVPGEVLRPVEPLPDPVAMRLLTERGAAARPGFRVEEDPEACAEICRRLDGLPLAIELAAARLRMLTPRQIADRLDDRFRLLTSGARTLLPRQQTLRAVVDWSWDLLSEQERDVLSRLSVFAGGCDLAAAEAVCGPAALDALGSLVDKSLVVAAPSGTGEMRYRLLETVAEYAGERLDEAGLRAGTERAHLTYYRELARTTDPLLRGERQLLAIQRFQLEYENLRTALRHAVAERDEQEALCLVLSLIVYWQMRDLRFESRNWCTEVMALGPDPFTAPVRRAEPVWERCTAAPPPMTGEVLAEARRGVHLGHLATMDTDFSAWETPEAKEKLRIVSETYEPGMPQVCRVPGLLWFYAVMLTGGVTRLPDILNAAVDTCRRTPGFEYELAGALQMRANLFANRTEWVGDAAADADESLELYQRLGDTWGIAEALSARAEAHERTGAYALAAADYESALVHAERLGARAQTAILDARLGSVLLEAGDHERGERLLREVVGRQDGAANEARPAARMFLAGWLGTTGRAAEAREHTRLMREELGISHFVVFDAFILGVEAWIDAVDEQWEPALDKVRRALERSDDPLSEAIAPHMRSAYLAIAAVVLGGLGRAADSARVLGAADALLPSAHCQNYLEQDSRARARRLGLAVLSEAEYGAAYAEGGGLSMEEAAALV